MTAESPGMPSDSEDGVVCDVVRGADCSGSIRVVGWVCLGCAVVRLRVVRRWMVLWRVKVLRMGGALLIWMSFVFTKAGLVPALI